MKPQKSPLSGQVHRSLKGRMLLLVAAVATATSIVLGSSSIAGAWAWDPTVALSGRAIACSRPATWVWVEASNGERGWATQPGGNYSFRFTRVPTSGMTVRVNFGNGACNRSTSFGVNRPSTGISSTRNVITIY